MNSLRTTMFSSVAAVVAAVTFLPSAIAIDRQVVVNGSSSSDPIGVGFGHWEGAEPLKIILSADPCEIDTAEMFAPEAVIWSPTDASKPDPWIFETVAILPDQAFAVQFVGTLDCDGKGGGKAPPSPPDWAVAVSDIDLDCDSDNDGARPGRAPSGSEIEDAVELALGNSGSVGQGMLMEIGEEWAMLRVTAHVRKASEFTLVLQGPAADSFVLANDNFQPLGRPGHVEAVSPGTLNRTFYVKPSEAATDQDTAVVSAMLIADQGSASGVAEDKTAVTAQKPVWKCDAPDGQVVVLNADGVYNDARNPAKSKRLVITAPETVPENTTFRLRRSAKLALFFDEAGTQPIPTNAEGLTDPIPAPAAGKSKTYYVRGAVSKDLSGRDASATLNDQSIALLVGAAAAPECEKSWTVLWVELSVRGTQADAVSPDNNGIYSWSSEFHAAEVEPNVTQGPKSLGAKGNGIKWGIEVFQNQLGLSTGVEIKGGVHPSDYNRRLAWQRDIMGYRIYASRNGVVETITGGAQSEDAIESSLSDTDPQSGGSTGVIYDLDGPSIRNPFPEYDPSNDEEIPVGSILKHRANYQQWALHGSERCSERMPWYVRLARRRIAVEDLKPYESVGGAEENFGRRGVTGLGYGGDADPSMMVAVVADPTYQYLRLATRATASVVGQFTPGVTFNWFFDQHDGPVVRAPGDRDSQDHEFRPDRFNRGRHKIAVEATDSSTPPLNDVSSVDVFTNREPIAEIVYAKLSADGKSVLFKGTGSDPEGKLAPPDGDGALDHDWELLYLDETGEKMFDNSGPFGLGVDLQRQIPVGLGPSTIVVILSVFDEVAAGSKVVAVLDVPED